MRNTIPVLGLTFLAVICQTVGSIRQPPDNELPPSFTPTTHPAALPQAFLTSQRVVYALGDPIDLTFAVSAAGGPITPRFSIVNAAGETMPAVQQSGKFFWERGGKALDGKERSGVIAANQAHTETITDLRQWYGLALPGLYEVTFDGTWTDEQKKPQLIPSNTILIKIVDPADPAEEGVMEGRTIPLADIWALDMPGTQPMSVERVADGVTFRSTEGEVVAEILATLANKIELEARAPEAFIVVGDRMSALREANAVLAGRTTKQHTIRCMDQAWIVFYSLAFNNYVHIIDVQQDDDVVTVTCRLEPHETKEMTRHFAMIPITLTRPAHLCIEIKPQLPAEVDDLALRRLFWTDRILCKSFETEVVN